MRRSPPSLAVHGRLVLRELWREGGQKNTSHVHTCATHHDGGHSKRGEKKGREGVSEGKVGSCGVHMFYGPVSLAGRQHTCDEPDPNAAGAYIYGA